MGVSIEYLIAKQFMMFCGNEQPCNFNGMDDYTDEWCEDHCGKCDPMDCWIHALHEKWVEKCYENWIKTCE